MNGAPMNVMRQVRTNIALFISGFMQKKLYYEIVCFVFISARCLAFCVRKYFINMINRTIETCYFNPTACKINNSEMCVN